MTHSGAPPRLAPTPDPSASAIVAAPAAPTNSCPSAPMFSTPARNAMATAVLVSRSGTVRTRVADVIAYVQESLAK